MTGPTDDILDHLLARADAADEAFAEQPDAEHADALVEAWTAVVDHDGTAALVNELGNALLSRFEVDCRPADLVQARLSYERAIELSGRADPGYLNNLGNTLYLSYQDSPEPALLDQAIEVLTEASTAKSANPIDPAEQATYADNLRDCLADRYERYGELIDLERAISSSAWAVRLTPRGAPVRGWRLAVMGDLHIEHYRRDGDRAALDRAVDAATEALAATDLTAEAYPRRLASLGAALHHRWDDTGQPTDRDAAESAFRAAAERLADPAVAAVDAIWQVGGDLGVHYLYRYRAGGTREDLDAALRWLRPALQAHGHGSARLLNNVGNALRLRYELGGWSHDLDEAIDLLHQSVAAAASAPSLAAAGYLLDLANARLDRYERDGTLDDLDDAVRLAAEATQRCPVRSPERAGALNDFANALRTRFTHIRAAVDLTEAEHALIEALDLAPPGSPSRYLILDNLANLAVDEFTMTGDVGWLRRAVALFDEALVTSPDSSERVRVLANMAGALWHQWQVSGDLNDLTLAVAAFDEAVRRTPPETPARAVRLNNLAVALLDRYASETDPADAQAARAAFEEASAPRASADALWALRAAREWGRWALDRDEAEEAALAYGRAHTAMRELLTLQSGRVHKEHWLREAAGIAVEAGRASYLSRQLTEAVVRLELGRALLLLEALTPPERLLARLTEAGYGELADGYRRAVVAVVRSGADR